MDHMPSSNGTISKERGIKDKIMTILDFMGHIQSLQHMLLVSTLYILSSWVFQQHARDWMACRLCLLNLAKTRRKQWHPTPVFLPGESQGRGNLVGCRLWGRTELDMTEAT